ncbi:M48 family metallopeptidase [Acidimicrobiales bacterium]|nr:M48 family metallopeptidase [Acidimicrobiales bacterium]
MNTSSAYLSVSGIDVDVTYKAIKNLHIGVYPPLGRVRVSAPDQLDDDNVRLAIINRLPWIKKQRQRMLDADRQTEREMVTGESHYVWGERFRLKVMERAGRPHVELDGDRMLLFVEPGSTADQKRDLLQSWHRTQLRAAIPDLIAKWEPIVGKQVSKWSIRRMRTKWGSCNRETGHIWFNLELATKHPDCLEYLVVHEMTHLIERSHGPRFTKQMDQFLPDWRARRDQLNQASLDHQEWSS